MIKICKGDTFMFNYHCELKNHEIYEFQPGDKLNIVIYESLNKNNYINKIIDFTYSTKNVSVLIESQIMSRLKCGLYNLEIKLITKTGPFTTYKNELTICESWCSNE